jgi:hypothetical protein
MEQIANQIDRDDTGDIVKDMQNAPSSTDNLFAAPTGKGGSEGVGGSGNGNTGVGGSGSGGSDDDEGAKVIVFNSTNFENGRVFQLKDSDGNKKIIGFYKNDPKATLNVVQWQVINGDNIEPLGNAEFSNAKPDRQLTDGMLCLECETPF